MLLNRLASIWIATIMNAIMRTTAAMTPVELLEGFPTRMRSDAPVTGSRNLGLRA